MLYVSSVFLLTNKKSVLIVEASEKYINIYFFTSNFIHRLKRRGDAKDYNAHNATLQTHHSKLQMFTYFELLLAGNYRL